MTETPAAGLFAERKTEADGFSVRYYEAGDGDPLLVVHGAGGVQLTPALGILSQAFRVCAVELPGWGEQANERSETLDDLAVTVAAAGEAIGLARYHLLGTSLGGAVALHMALLYPDRVSSLILEGPAQFRVGSRSPAEIPPDQLVRAFRAHPEREPAFQSPDPQAMARYWPIVDRVLTRAPGLRRGRRGANAGMPGTHAGAVRHQRRDHPAGERPDLPPLHAELHAAVRLRCRA